MRHEFEGEVNKLGYVEGGKVPVLHLCLSNGQKHQWHRWCSVGTRDEILLWMGDLAIVIVGDSSDIGKQLVCQSRVPSSFKRRARTFSRPANR